MHWWSPRLLAIDEIAWAHCEARRSNNVYFSGKRGVGGMFLRLFCPSLSALLSAFYMGFASPSSLLLSSLVFASSCASVLSAGPALSCLFVGALGEADVASPLSALLRLTGGS